jgi:peptide-methionine (S)-S-oxide reductase
MDEERSEGSLEVATLGAGCFWCVEAVFQRLHGVEKVVSGYSGGHLESPGYEQVCSGNTGHAEVCQIHYDPYKISFRELLEIFWMTHDPTTRNRQGNDIGSQYRSVILYHNERQKQEAEEVAAKLEAEKIWNHPLVTEIIPFTRFWPAEGYHQNYYNDNSDKGYCSLVIAPKLKKFKDKFRDKLRVDESN